MTTYHLERFKEAQRQSVDGQWTAVAELRSGRKTGHWIWYILPQLGELGRSARARYYGISCLEEAIAYLADDELSTNLYEACKAILDSDVTDPVILMGSRIDATKLQSSMTLFELASAKQYDGKLVFSQILDKFFAGKRDQVTLSLIGGETIEFGTDGSRTGRDARLL